MCCPGRGALSGERQRPLRLIEGYRRLEWPIEPGPQIAINEQLLAQQRDQIRQTPWPGARSCRYRTSNIAISAVQICVCTAFSLVPMKVLMRNDCLMALT